MLILPARTTGIKSRTTTGPLHRAHLRVATTKRSGSCARRKLPNPRRAQRKKPAPLPQHPSRVGRRGRRGGLADQLFEKAQRDQQVYPATVQRLETARTSLTTTSPVPNPIILVLRVTGTTSFAHRPVSRMSLPSLFHLCVAATRVEGPGFFESPSLGRWSRRHDRVSGATSFVKVPNEGLGPRGHRMR